MPPEQLLTSIEITAAGLAVKSWADVATAVGVIGALCAALGALVGAAVSRNRDRRDAASADDVASDRLIALITKEADKRVEIARLEFQAKLAEVEANHAQQLAELKLTHAEELRNVRAEFEQRLSVISREQTSLRHDLDDATREG